MKCILQTNNHRQYLCHNFNSFLITIMLTSILEFKINHLSTILTINLLKQTSINHTLRTTLFLHKIISILLKTTSINHLLKTISISHLLPQWINSFKISFKLLRITIHPNNFLKWINQSITNLLLNSTSQRYKCLSLIFLHNLQQIKM